MSARNFFSELRRRNVYKVAIAYCVVAWLLIQIATQIFPFFEIPHWAVRLVILLLLLGLPVALILSWAYELTPEGFKLSDNVAPQQSITRRTGRHLIAFVTMVAAIALSFFIFRYVAAHSAPVETNPDPALAAREKSIAVLPFENLSANQENAFFTDGVQDEILTDLSKVSDLKVISRTSVKRYRTSEARNLRQIAQELGVTHVVEGSVQRDANRIRLTAQLIDARTDTHLWADTYDRELADVFAIQSEVARAVVTQLRAQLSPREAAALHDQPTTDLAAYDLYLRAKERVDKVAIELTRGREENLEAVRLLDQAIARDPSFFAAHCLLAYAHDSLYWYNYDHTRERLQLAETSVRAALRLRPDSGEAHLAQATHSYWGYLDYSRARGELKFAQDALPNNPQIYLFLGAIDRRQGQWEDSAKNLEKALELDPRNLLIHSNLMSSYLGLRRYPEATNVVERALQIDARNTYFRIKRAQLERDAFANPQPLRELLAGLSNDPNSSPELLELAVRDQDPAAAERALQAIGPDGYADDNSFPFPRPWCEALVAELRGNSEAMQKSLLAARAELARKVAAQPTNAKPLAVLARIDVRLGQKEQAVAEAKHAVELLPMARDALDGANILLSLARVYARAGEKDLAIEQLALLARTAGGPSYGELRLDRNWDTLRDDPRFEQVVTSLAPSQRPAR